MNILNNFVMNVQFVPASRYICMYSLSIYLGIVSKDIGLQSESVMLDLRPLHWAAK